MKAAIATLAALLATPALAHPGHLTENAGHSHWYVLGTLGVALVIAGVALRGQRRARRTGKAERKA